MHMCARRAPTLGSAQELSSESTRRRVAMTSARPDHVAPAPMVWMRARGDTAKREPYVAAHVIAHNAAAGTIRVVAERGTRESVEVSENDTVLRNPPGARPDNCQLLHLNEACVLDNVCTRFMEGQIYTWTSRVLTSVNPYEPLPLYSDQLVAELHTLNPRDLPPHAFSLAEMAVRGVVRESQAIVVSGESGSGKTTNMAHVMAYLTRRARNAGHNDSALGDGLGALLLQSNPVLEAFGNAQTVRNHNSSRFGKFIKVRVCPCHRVHCSWLSPLALSPTLVRRGRSSSMQVGPA